MAPVPAGRRQIHSAVMLCQGGVTSRPSGFGIFRQAPARRHPNYTGKRCKGSAR